MNVLFSYSSGALNDREIVKFTDDAAVDEILEDVKSVIAQLNESGG